MRDVAVTRSTSLGVSAKFDAYHFNDAATALYRFVWNDFCDWYLEIVKPRLASKYDTSVRSPRSYLLAARA